MKAPTFREALIVSLALALGWWAHTRPVLAAVDAGIIPGFQFSNIGPQTSLSVYSPADHTLTVYSGATTGNSHLTCTYQYKITRPGGPIDRTNCQPGSLLP